jgi:hypothetical protein
MGSTDASYCDYKVLVHPQILLTPLTPEGTSQLQVLVVNTGGTPIDWNVTEQPCGDWVKVNPSSGALNSSKHTLINLTVSYPKELAPVNRPADPTWQAEVNVANKKIPVTVNLERKPGRFSAKQSTIESWTSFTGAVGKATELIVRTKDQYGQDWHSSAELGNRMWLNVSSATRSCKDVCGRDCADEECCCQDNFDGTYFLAFTPKQAGDYKVQVVADGQMLRFKDGDGTLAIRDGGSTCGSMTIEQGLLNGASASQLHVDIHNAKEPPKLLLSRANASTELNSTENKAGGVWGFTEELKTGQWQIDYRSGSEVCSTTLLMEVNCSADYEEKGGKCKAHSTDSNGSPIQIIAGAIIGMLAVAGFAGVVYYFLKNPDKFKSLLASFVRNEVSVMVSLCLEIWDMFGDGYLTYSVMKDSTMRAWLGSDVVITWICFACIAAVVSTLCLYLKVRTYLIILRQRRAEFTMDNLVRDAYSAKHAERMLDARKEIKKTHADLLAGSLEDAPFGILGLLYLLKGGTVAESHLLQMLSVASSFLMLGVKVSRLPQLVDFMEYEAKQKQKCWRITLKALTEDMRRWFEAFPQLKRYHQYFEGIAADRMLQLTNEELVRKFEMESDVDRQYLLLQLARVREHEKRRISVASGGVLHQTDRCEPSSSIEMDPMATSIRRSVC